MKRDSILRAQCALAEYIGDDVADESHIRDLMADLFHLAKSEGMAVVPQIRSALLNYCEESDDETAMEALAKLDGF